MKATSESIRHAVYLSLPGREGDRESFPAREEYPANSHPPRHNLKHIEKHNTYEENINRTHGTCRHRLRR